MSVGYKWRYALLRLQPSSLGGEREERIIRLPCDIGTSPSCQVTLPVPTDQEDDRVAGRHAVIRPSSTASGLVIEPTAGIPIETLGQSTFQAAPIPDGGTFAIGQTFLEVAHGNGIYLDWTSHSGKKRRLPLFSDYAFTIGRDPSKADIVVSRSDPTVSSVHGMFESIGNKMRVRTLSRTNKIYVNRRLSLPFGEAADVEVGDTVNFGKLPVRILRAHDELLQCGNPECGLLNDYKPEAECRWCGNHLSSGATLRFTQKRST